MKMMKTMKKHDKDAERCVFNLVDALRSPVLTHSSSWADCIPERIIRRIPEARMINLMQEIEMATDIECSAFIMTASMEAPLDRDWTDIYTHVACKTLQDWFGEDHWEEVRAPRTLTEYQRNYLLNPLKKHIYEKRRKILRQRMKEEPALSERVIDQAKEMQNRPVVVGQQLSLF